MVEVRLETRCHPTEERDKVVKAILALFPDAGIEGDDPVIGISHSVEVFSQQLAKQRIRDAARNIMKRGIDGRQCTFRLNKQVATVGKVSFSIEQHALGDVQVTITHDDIDGLIQRMAPDAKDEVTE